MSKENIEKLEAYVRAYTPLVYIVTSEEDRVSKEIENMTKNLGIPFKYRSWSCCSGFVNSEEEDGDTAKTHSAVNALREVMKNKDHSVYVLKDFDVYFNEANTVRMMREIALKSKGKETVVVISPRYVLPVYLEKEMMILDWDLPTEGEITEILDADETVKDSLKKAEKILLVESAKGLSKPEIDEVLAIACTKENGQGLPDPDDFMDAKKQIIRKSSSLDFISIGSTGFGGYDLLKEWFRKRRNHFSEKAKEYGLPPIRGVMLVGPPGVGKTTAALEAARMIGINQVIDFDIDNVLESTVGSSEENMVDALKILSATAPNIVFLDEFEKMIGGIQSSAQTEGGVTEHIVKKFLRWLQDREEKGITSVIIGTINKVENIPPEMMRGGGRIDKIFFLDLPNVNERAEIFSIWLGKRKRNAEKFSVNEFAEASERFSGAEITQSIDEALFEGFNRGKEIDDGFVLNAIENTTPLAVFDPERVNAVIEWAKKAKAQPASTLLKSAGKATHLTLGKKDE